MALLRAHCQLYMHDCHLVFKQRWSEQLQAVPGECVELMYAVLAPLTALQPDQQPLAGCLAVSVVAIPAGFALLFPTSH